MAENDDVTPVHGGSQYKKFCLFSLSSSRVRTKHHAHTVLFHDSTKIAKDTTFPLVDIVICLDHTVFKMKSYMNPLLLALSSVSLCHGFTLVPQPAASMKIRHKNNKRGSSALGVSFAANAVEDETLYRQLLNKARACAFSDTSSPADARQYLHDILHMESGCVAGTLAADFCDNVDETADIVVHLREKAAKQDALDLMERESQAHFIFPLIAAVAFMTVMSMIVSTSTTNTIDMGNTGGAIPFELQEWGWAARDGYLTTMVEHYFRNGGL
jgi:hypothetical protein